MLVVEDDPAVVQFITDALEMEGYQVLHASGTDALALARAAQPALILLDGRMPDKSGAAVSQELAADPRTAGIPIISMSATAPSCAMQAAAHLTKPFDLDTLYALVARWTTAHTR